MVGLFFVPAGLAACGGGGSSGSGGGATTSTTGGQGGGTTSATTGTGGTTSATTGTGGSASSAGGGGSASSAGGGGSTSSAGGNGGSGGAPPSCGDGKLDNGEECDQGAQNADTGACTTQCKNAVCGDGLVQSGVEQCDQGAQNADTGACTLACKNAVCGDGLVQSGVEQCDLGAQNANAGACTLACKNAACGDGFKGPGEACDDGNVIDGDGCDSNCQLTMAPLWTRTYNGAANGDDLWNGVTTDAQGNVIVTGSEPIAGQGLDVITRKYDPAGNVVWTRRYTGPMANGNDEGQAVTADAQGNVIVVGYEQTQNQGKNIWLRKYTANGNVSWTQSINGNPAVNGNDLGYGIAHNAAGDLFLACSAQNVAGQSQNIFVLKISGATGNPVWLDTQNGTGNKEDEAYGVAVDAQGNVIVAGYTRTPTDTDIWVRKYADLGNNFAITWTKTFNGPASGLDAAFGVAVDGAGNPVVAGIQSVNGQGANIWVSKLDPMGSMIWSQSYANPSGFDDVAESVAVDGGGNVLVAGRDIAAAGTSDVWVRKYSPAGNVLWTQVYDDALNGIDGALSVTTDANGNVFAAGFEATAGQGQDAWLRKYAP
ncbi:MAG: hypothetical protein U0359_25610 [Byssovorax sp.]